MEQLNTNIEFISNKFQLAGEFIESNSFGNGHINDTQLVKMKQDGRELKLILRKINKYVFKKPEIVIENTINVIAHINRKLIENNVPDRARRVMTLLISKENKDYYIDEQGDYWCAVKFIDSAYTVDYVKSVEQAYQAAKAFGRFQYYLIDADLEMYQPTIPDFHNLPIRLENLGNAISADKVKRVNKTDIEIKMSNKFHYIKEKIIEISKDDGLPIRITHNDTKINNVMLDEFTGEGLCVIDLDTCMPGTVLNDFGDMVRTSVSPSEEDEKDISQIYVRMDVFEALVNGYVSELKNNLIEIETDNLVYGAKLIVYEQAVRFLTDYLMGDVYYSTAYEDHNLVRARNQFTLLQSIEENSEEMEKIVKKFAE